jgi:TonB family protein
MNREQWAEELDCKIDALMKDPARQNEPLLRIAAELRMLPAGGFKSLLRADLMERADALELNSGTIQADAGAILSNPDFVPSFSRQEFAALPADPRSLFLSFISHAAVVALIASGIWAGHQTVIKSRPLSADLTYIPLPPGDIAPHGGGGGGDRSTVQASRGTPPKFSNEQLTPPAIVVRNENPKLPAPPTVLGPPDLKLPQSARLGDLVSSNVAIPSNGTGSRGGLGDGSGTGDGIGNGPGVGPGRNGGFGGDTFRVGNGVSAPRAIYNPDPEYSDEARRAKFQGNVVLSLVVDPTGHVRDIHVARSLGMGLDEKALEAVRKWKFNPGMKDGYPVAVQVNVEVNFRLY